MHTCILQTVLHPFIDSFIHWVRWSPNIYWMLLCIRHCIKYGGAIVNERHAYFHMILTSLHPSRDGYCTNCTIVYICDKYYRGKVLLSLLKLCLFAKWFSKLMNGQNKVLYKVATEHRDLSLAMPGLRTHTCCLVSSGTLYKFLSPPCSSFLQKGIRPTVVRAEWRNIRK